MVDYQKIKDYFLDCFTEFGPQPKGLNWNSKEAQDRRFEQICKLIDFSIPFSIIDYGCGYGSLIEYLKNNGQDFSYLGYDIVDEIIIKGREMHQNDRKVIFVNSEDDLTKSDYVLESGVFNAKQSFSDKDWTEYVIKSLNTMNNLAVKGLAFNFLTKYSDAELMRPHLYYADPLFYFDYCKRNFSRNVALLHDYDLFDFTIIVRK
jgi:SAM-dependent methyltransferase